MSKLATGLALLKTFGVSVILLKLNRSKLEAIRPNPTNQLKLILSSNIGSIHPLVFPAFY